MILSLIVNILKVFCVNLNEYSVFFREYFALPWKEVKPIQLRTVKSGG